MNDPECTCDRTMRKNRTKHVTTITVTDPDSGLPVDVEILKMETGPMVGVDASYLEQDIGPVLSPYDPGVELKVD